MKRNNTKKALVLSAISILVCFTMLIGSTFAWFTDTASTAVNAIQSGTLDIVLEYKNGETWTDAEGQTLAWNRHCTNGIGLWEPGCTYSLPAIRVRNNGNLSLKYKICINGVQGDAELLEVIDWTVKLGETEIDLAAFEGVLYPADINPMPEDGNSESGEITISGHMREEAGNEYQNLTLEGIGITVYATQYTWECDSYGHEYDAEATYPVPVASAEELSTAIQDLRPDEAIQLSEDITIDSVIPQSESNVTNIDLNGHTLTTTSDSSTTIADGAVLNIQNGTFAVNSLENITTSAVKIDAGGKVNVSGVTMQTNGVAFFATGTGAEVTITNSTIEAGTYCVSTNAANESNYNPVFNLENSTFRGSSPILVNVPCTLNIDNCTVEGSMHGVVVRGGTAVIKDSVITMNEPDGNLAHYFDERNWGSGNEVNLAGLTIGNKHDTAYQYPSNVTLINTNVTSVNTVYPAVYIIGNTGEGLSAALTYDAACVFNTEIIQGNTSVTVTPQ